jgi:tetratricopeptide (TPR) repeat protein
MNANATAVKRRCRLLFGSVIVPWTLLGVLPQDAMARNGGEVRPAPLGEVEFPVSCATEVQPAVSEAVALLHNMQYVEAEKAFLAVAERSPECAMAHWGVAMTYMRPLWLDPATFDDFLRQGRAAIRRAETAQVATSREREHVAAVAAFFDAATIEEGLRSWEEGLAKLHRADESDLETAALYALAHLAGIPTTVERREASGAMLEELFARAPRHPGAIHYLIHAYDHPLLAERGLAAARAYADVAPEAPHALHMPSHIFVRLGLWADAEAWNRRSGKAALALPLVDGKITNHYPHAVAYLVHALLQLGRDDEARTEIEDFLNRAATQGFETEIASAYHLAEVPARFALDRQDWEEAAGLPVGEPESFPWDLYPQAEAMIWHARGVGAARLGRQQAAREAIAALDRIYEAVVGEASECDWSVTVDAQRKSVAAWLALARGEHDAASELAAQAADLEDSATSSATAGWIATVPARELQGDLLLELDQPEEARRAFEETLETTPRRLNALFGAALAAERAGDRDAATAHYRQLVEMAGDASRDRVTAARTALASSE